MSIFRINSPRLPAPGRHRTFLEIRQQSGNLLSLKKPIPVRGTGRGLEHSDKRM